ncbi:MAG: type II toxin-antitoxin system VapC family toxin [Pirellulaceae bacterium]
MKSVVDASAVLAVCHKEAGADKARDRMRHGLISTVNLSEVLQKSMERQKLDIAKAIIHTANLQIVDFNAIHALHAAELATMTRKMGISFADRACLALGMVEELPIVTGDRRWLDLPIDAKIEVFRPEMH